jgi:hypothetical protein
VQVRQLMFFILATSSVMDAVDALAAAATAALTVPVRSSRKRSLASWILKPQQQQQQQQKDAQLLPQAINGTAGDIEAGSSSSPAAAAAPTAGLHLEQQQQQQNGPAAAAKQPAAAAAAAAAEPSCGRRLLSRLRSGFARHTAWVSPWLPLAQNRIQFAHMKVALTRELPAMLSSKEGEAVHVCACLCVPACACQTSCKDAGDQSKTRFRLNMQLLVLLLNSLLLLHCCCCVQHFTAPACIFCSLLP